MKWYWWTMIGVSVVATGAAVYYFVFYDPQPIKIRYTPPRPVRPVIGSPETPTKPVVSAKLLL